jgi:hypothetical protein
MRMSILDSDRRVYVSDTLHRQYCFGSIGIVHWGGPAFVSATAMHRAAAIHLVGPGGAGKSTLGLALATRLGVAFIDLDEQFKIGSGDISAYIEANGYDAYAEQNVRVCRDTRSASRGRRHRVVVGIHDVQPRCPCGVPRAARAHCHQLHDLRLTSIP